VRSSGGHADSGYLLDTSGSAAPPRDNGELVFAAPWQSRAFGLALALREAGRIDWEGFRRLLIAEVGSWPDGGSADGDGSYYACWLRALERLLGQHGLVTGDELSARVSLLAARPPDHGPGGGGPVNERPHHRGARRGSPRQAGAGHAG
jgi:nitrile hydratase accessory protein